MTDTPHSPLPWSLSGNRILSAIYDANDDEVVTITMGEDTSVENLSLIVEAVNSHARLEERVEELEGLVSELADDLESEIGSNYLVDGKIIHPSYSPKYERDMDVIYRARAALSKQEVPPK